MEEEEKWGFRRQTRAFDTVFSYATKPWRRTPISVLLRWGRSCLAGWLWLCRGVAVLSPCYDTADNSTGKCQFRMPWNYLPSVPSPELWVNTTFLLTVMKPSVFQNKYCSLVTNINKCIAHYIFGEECARPTFLKSKWEVLPLFPSSPLTGKLPLGSVGIYKTENYRGTPKYFRVLSFCFLVFSYFIFFFLVWK